MDTLGKSLTAKFALFGMTTFVALNMPTSAIAAGQCVMPKSLAEACKYPASALCKNAKARAICNGPVAGSASNACLAGSCVAPKGKTLEEWAAMSEASRKTYVLQMPAADRLLFDTKVQKMGH
jgi:putative hemolysin